MRCEICQTSLGKGLVCPRCGPDELATRRTYRRRLRTTVTGWHDAGLVPDGVSARLLRRISQEERALSSVGPVVEEPPAAAPEPPPVIAPPRGRSWPLPRVPEGSAGSPDAGLGAWLRERTGWVTGVALTVVGSIYLAGSIWAELPPLSRQALVWIYLALSAWGFATLGRRLGRREGNQTAARWLQGVSIALVPAHALTAGGLWSLGMTGAVAAAIALLATGLLHRHLVARSLPEVCPDTPAAFRDVWLGLALSVGLLPLVTGPGWLLLPGLGALTALWLLVTRTRGVGAAAGLLLVHVLGFHLLFTPPGSLPAYAPLFAQAALGLLYVDVARARWRGLNRVRPTGWLGVSAVALGVLALVMLAPTLAPLPTGVTALVTSLLLVPLFFGGAAAWRRPVVFVVGLASALVAVLALPDLFAELVQWLALLAGQALGYTDEPLPLAWYSLTLLPYLAACRWLETWLERSTWRQGSPLATVTRRWGLALSAGLVVAAHSRPDDLRPALLALPLHGLLWAWGRRWRHSPWALAGWALATLWAVDAVVFAGGSSWTAGLVAGSGALVAAWTARSWLPRARTTEWILAAAGLLAVLAALAGLGHEAALADRSWAWAAGALGLAAAAGVAASRRWMPEVVGPPRLLELAAHGLVAAAVVFALDLSGLDRALAKIPVAAVVLHWLWKHRHPAYGVVACLGLCELVLRQVHGLGVRDERVLVSLAALIAWLPLAARVASDRLPAWLDRALFVPSAWVGGLACAVAVPMLTIDGLQTRPHAVLATALAGAVALGAWRFRHRGLVLAAQLLGSWAAVAGMRLAEVPLEGQAWVLLAVAAGLSVLGRERDWARLLGLAGLGFALAGWTDSPMMPGTTPLLLLASGWVGYATTGQRWLTWAGALAGASLAAVSADLPLLAAPVVVILALSTTGWLVEQAREDLRLTLPAGALFAAWLVGIAPAGGLLVPVVLAHAAGLVALRVQGRSAALPPLGVGAGLWFASLGLVALGLDQGSLPALPVLLLALVSLGTGRRRLGVLLAPMVALAAAQALGEPILDTWPLCLVIVGLAARPWLPIATVLALGLAAVLDAAGPGPLAPWIWLAPLVACGVDLAEAWRTDRTRPLWRGLAWLAWAIGWARFDGPLAALPADWIVPVTVAFALVLEAGRVLVVRHDRPALARPLEQVSATLPLAGLLAATSLGALTTWGLALVGSLHLLRFVSRSKSADLVLGAVLVDTACLWSLLDAGWTDPVVLVAPVSLTVLIVARLLRDALGPQVVALMRYAAAGALYVAAFGSIVVTQEASLVMLVLSLAGLGAGVWLRVRAYVHVGAAFAVATLVVDAVRFGLTHSQFWALYLTLLGVAILGAMVLLTVHRERLGTWRSELSSAMSGWE